jgi:hypothetical protein
MNEERQTKKEECVEPQKKVAIYGVKGGQKPPGSGRKPGQLNKRKMVPIETILELIAESLGKEHDAMDVTAIYRLYKIMWMDDVELGLPKGTITLEMSINAAKHLSQFELPKKRAVEVTGAQLVGGNFVISTGRVKPEDESPQEQLDRGRQEVEAVERGLKEKRLAELEAEKEAERLKAPLH